VRSGTDTLFSIRLDLTLEGPKPWHARGTGSFEIGFIITVTISVSFNVTFGADDNPELPPIKVAPLIEDALRADGNWRVLSDGNLRQHVSVRSLPAGAGVVIPPMGVLGVTQKIAPLGLTLTRFGSRHVDGSAHFSIVNVTVGGGSVSTTPATDLFAAAQFLDLSDAEKLSRRSYEPFDAGIEVTGANAPKADYQRGVDVAYEVIYFRKPRRNLVYRLGDALLDLYTAVSAAARSKFSATRREPTGLGTPKVTTPPETFVVAGVTNLQAHAANLVFTSEAAAALAMNDLVAKNPSLTGTLQVVSSYEVAA
jgi:hypothetical protein